MHPSFMQSATARNGPVCGWRASPLRCRRPRARDAAGACRSPRGNIERAAPALRDASVYPLFYQQGATFFAELDRTLQEATRGERSLDDFVPKIRSNEDGTLPEDLIVAWRAVAGDAVDKLVARYVGQ
jgi:hypothetical protein